MTRQPALDDLPDAFPELIAAWWRQRLHGAERAPRAGAGGALPGPARRWLSRAVAAGAAAGGVARLRQRGEIRLRRWREFTADWLLAPDGFVWAATTKVGPLPVRGFDRLTDGVGEMRWRLFGRLPLIRAAGEDVTRSAAGRLAGELVFDPAALLRADVRWEPVDEQRAVARVPIAARAVAVTITVGGSGRLRRVELLRWGNPDRRAFAEHLFTAEFDETELSADGVTVPAAGRAGWWRCPDGCADEEFFRFRVLAAHYR